MKMRFKRTGAMLLACAMLCGTVPLYAGALFGTAITANAAGAGKGTEDSPYIVKTYDELKELISPSDPYAHIKSVDTVTYVKLGADIELEDDTNNRYFNIYSNGTGVWTIKLDLAGHKLSRKATTLDTSMFTIGSNGTLVIDDSVGGGEVVSDLSCGSQSSAIFYTIGGSNLIINNGTFESFGGTVYHQRCIESQGGNVTINGGTFKAISYIVDNQRGQVTINNGTFIQKKDCKYAQDGISLHFKDIINNAVLKSEDTTTHIWCYLSHSTYLADNVISPNSKVIVDGNVLARENFDNKITGKEIIIRTPKVIDKVNISITEPKAGQNISYLADTNDPETVNTWGVRNEMRQRGLIRAWLEGDTVLNGDKVNKFTAGNTYTAKFSIMTEQDGDTFSNDLEVTVNGKPVENLKIDSKSESATFSITYDLKKQKGDVTGDGKITVTDITKVAAHIKSKKLLTEEQQALADIDGNGKINVTDLTRIAAHVKGKKLIV